MRSHFHLTFGVALAALLSASAAAQLTGDPRSWGLNEDGPLGDGIRAVRGEPIPVTGFGGTVAIAAGANLGPKAPVRVLLSRDGGAHWSEIGVVPNLGWFDWTVAGPPTTRARIRVEWTNGPVQATSGIFTIFQATSI